MTSYRTSRFPLIMVAFFMLIQFGGASSAEELGRLFTTPAERSLLDKLRNPSAATSQSQPAEETETAEHGHESNDVTIKGLVYRKNGRGTIWLNNSHLHVQQLQINADENNAGNVQIKIPDSKVVISLRPEEMHHPYIK